MSDIQKQEANNVPQISTKELTKFLDLYGHSNIPQKEKELFIELCKLNQLNPFKREAHISAYGEGKFRQFSVITGYEVYIRRAEESGRLDGWNVKIEACKSVKLNPDGSSQFINDIKAVLVIHRKDFEKPFIHEVKLSEYIGKKKDGTPTQFWLKMPETMLKKVAISQGFRLCFNEVLGGMPYTKEEMTDFEVVGQQGEVTITKPVEKQRDFLSEINAATKINDLTPIYTSASDSEKQEILSALTDKKTELLNELAQNIVNDVYSLEQCIEAEKLSEKVAEELKEIALDLAFDQKECDGTSN